MPPLISHSLMHIQNNKMTAFFKHFIVAYFLPFRVLYS